MSIINDVMNPKDLLELDEDQFKVQLVDDSVDCDATTCGDCNVTDCPNYKLKGK